MGTLGLLKKFKNYIVLIVVPIVLISVFSFVDDRPTVCTPPCTLFASYAQRSSCEKAHKYASTFCQTRCMTNCFEYKNSTQVNSADITIANVELNKSCAKKWVDWKPSYPMPKNMTYAIRSEEITKEELWAHVKNQYDNQECYIVPADSRADVVDALDLTASDKTLVREYKAIFNSKKAAAAYGTLIMCIFWIFEIVPLTVTSIIPLFLFPMLGIVTSKAIAGFYFTSIIALFYGGLLVANAIERVNLLVWFERRHSLIFLPI